MPDSPLKALMTLSANLSHVSHGSCYSKEGPEPEAGESHGQRSGTSAILGLDNLVATELDA